MNEPTDYLGVGPTDGALMAALEQRIRRLEDAIAQIQDTHQVEERIVERLQRTLPGPPRSTTGLVIDAAKHLLTPSEPSLPPAHLGEAPRGYALARPWFLPDLVLEVRAMIRMFVDPRYRLGWQVRVGALVLVLAIFTSAFWIPGMVLLKDWWIGSIVDKIVDLLLAFVLYKLVSREARRYRETAPDLPTNLRL